MKKVKINIGIVGFGTMGSCLARCLDKRAFCVSVYEKDRKKMRSQKGLAFTKSVGELIKRSEVIFVAIKPQDMAQFLAANQSLLSKQKPLCISIAAGVSTRYFEKMVKGVRLVRVMPNVGVKIGVSTSFITKGRYASAKDLRLAKAIFDRLGISFVVSESVIDKATSISGSGPGYVYYFMQGIYEAAQKLGFDKKTSRTIVLNTFSAAIQLAKVSDKDFSALITDVASKKGTTEKALTVFKKRKLKRALNEGVQAAFQRAKELNLR